MLTKWQTTHTKIESKLCPNNLSAAPIAAHRVNFLSGFTPQKCWNDCKLRNTCRLLQGWWWCKPIGWMNTSHRKIWCPSRFKGNKNTQFSISKVSQSPNKEPRALKQCLKSCHCWGWTASPDSSCWWRKFIREVVLIESTFWGKLLRQLL